MQPDIVRARAPRAEAAFVGRRDAWRAMDAALERATRFDAPQFVTLFAASGMGKSRFLTEWLDSARARGQFRVVRAAAPRTANGRLRATGGSERFALVAAWLRDRFGLEDGLDRDSALSVFRNQLQAVFGDRRVAEVAAFLAPFVGFELPQSPLLHALSERPESYLDVARSVLIRFVEEDARHTPMIVALEDLEAADDASLDLFSELGRSLGEAPLVVVGTARPDLRIRRPEWGRAGGSHVQVELGPLGHNELMSLATSIVDPSEVVPEGLESHVQASEGSPGLLLERLSRTPAGRAAGLSPARSSIVSVEPLGNFPIETDRQAARRVSELSPSERELLGRAAAFGSMFWTGGVISLGRMGGAPPDPTTVFAPDVTIDEVRKMLDDLEERGFLMHLPEPSIAGETEWTFCQSAERALVAGVVDPELMRARRLFAAQWLEGRVGLDAVAERFEHLGNLYDGGGDARRAGECFVAAGDRSNAAGRVEQARTLYLRGIRLLDLDDGVFKMDALHKLGDVAARGGRVREALAHFAEMLQIAWRLDLPAKGGAAHSRIGRLHRGLGNYRVAERHLELSKVLFDLAADIPGVAASLDDLGRVAMLTGRVDEAMQRHREALKLREELGDDRGRALTLSWLGLCEVSRGELLAAERCFKASLELSRRAEDARGLAFALMDLAGVERELGRADRARPLLEEARGLVRGLSEPLSEAHLGVQIGECLLQSGRALDAARELEAARDLAQRFGTKRLMSQAIRGLAEVKLAGGEAVAARDLAEEALRVAEQIGVPALVGAALRVMGNAEAAGAPGDADRGGTREIFDRAVEVLSERGAELELGRVLNAYAEFEQATGRGAVATELRSQAAGIRARAWNSAEVGIFDRL